MSCRLDYILQCKHRTKVNRLTAQISSITQYPDYAGADMQCHFLYSWFYRFLLYAYLKSNQPVALQRRIILAEYSASSQLYSSDTLLLNNLSLALPPGHIPPLKFADERRRNGVLSACLPIGPSTGCWCQRASAKEIQVCILEAQ